MDATDYTEIAQLLARYCHIVDNKEWDRLLDVFAADGSMAVVSRHEPHVGEEALRVLYRDKMSHPLAHHSTSLVLLELGAGTARVASKWITVRADGTVGTGVYTDDLVRTRDGWRIKARTAQPGR